MVSTQPLTPPRTPLLRLLSPATTDFDPTSLPAMPVFDLHAVASARFGRAPLPEAELTPFSFDDYAGAAEPDDLEPFGSFVDEPPVPACVEPQGAAPELVHRQTGYLNGVSLSAVLQMLHLERKTCVVEVSARGWLGTLTLVNGELVDAAVGDCAGEEAACTILNWSNAQSSIIDGVELFRHTVQKPITSLIMDAVRIGDETGMLDPSRVADHFDEQDPGDAPVDHSGWQWLVDSLILIGASTARVVTAGSTEKPQTGFLGDQAGDLARGIRTWASLLGPDVTEVVVTRSDHIAILAMLDPDHTELIYAEASGPETAERIRRALRSIARHRQ